MVLTTQSESPCSIFVSYDKRRHASSNQHQDVKHEIDVYGYGDAAPNVSTKYNPGPKELNSCWSGSFRHNEADKYPQLALAPARGTSSMAFMKTGIYTYPAFNNGLCGYGEATLDQVPFQSPSGNSSMIRRRPSATATCTTPRGSSLKTSSSSSFLSSTKEDATIQMMQGQRQGHRRSSIQCGREFEVHLPGKETSRIRRSSITFDEKVHIKAVKSICGIIPNPESLWFQKNEYKQIRRESMDLVRSVEAEKVVSSINAVKQELDATTTTTSATSSSTSSSKLHYDKNSDSEGGNFISAGNNNNKKEKEEKKKKKSIQNCLRGLEQIIKESADRTKVNRLNAWDSVLDEQDYQRDSGHYDEDYIAKEYRHQSYPSLLEAVHRGEDDAQDIASYLAEERHLWNKSSHIHVII